MEGPRILCRLFFVGRRSVTNPSLPRKPGGLFYGILCRGLRSSDNLWPKSLRNSRAGKSKIGKDYARKPLVGCSGTAEESCLGDEQALSGWVEVPPHCVSHVRRICTLLSDECKQHGPVDFILKGIGIELTHDIVLGVLMNYKRIGRDRTMEFFSWAGRRPGYFHDNAAVDYMADFLGRRKLFDDLRCLLKTMSTRIDRVTPQTISIAIRFLGRAGRVEEALWLFDEMEKEFSCKPNNLVFNNVLYVLCKGPSLNKQDVFPYVDRALSILRKMDCPDTYSYSNVIIGLCKVGRLEKALAIFEEMHKNGVIPTRTAINNLIGGLCEVNKEEVSEESVQVEGPSVPFNILIPNLRKKNYLDPAMAVFSKMSGLGMSPSVFATNMLIAELCTSGEVAEALNIFRAMKERQLRCNDQTHSLIIQALCKAGRIEEASDFFSKMISEGFKPKIILYNSIISALCKSGNLKDAENYFHVMKKKHCLANNVTYTALIHGHCKADNWHAASNWLDELLGLGWLPHSHTSNLVNSLLRKTGKHDISEKLSQKMEINLIHNHCKAGEWEEAYQKLNALMARGFSPPIYILGLVEQAIQKAGKGRLAHTLRPNMEQAATK